MVRERRIGNVQVRLNVSDHQAMGIETNEASRMVTMMMVGRWEIGLRLLRKGIKIVTTLGCKALLLLI